MNSTLHVFFVAGYEIFPHLHGSLNVPIEHHPIIRYMVYNGYYKVMSNIPKMGHLPIPDLSAQKPESQPVIKISSHMLSEWFQHIPNTRPGKHTKNYGNSPFLMWAIFNSYVKLPEGIW